MAVEPLFGGRVEFQESDLGNGGRGISLVGESKNKEILCPLWKKANIVSTERGEESLKVIGLVKVESDMQI